MRDDMVTADLKRKLRQLKQYENTLRAKNNMGDGIPLVWDKFFNLRDSSKSPALYTLSKLATMDKNAYKSVIDEFFARIYYEVYVYKGIIDAPIYNPSLLEQLGLPPIADETDVKKRFRDLAKEYHPDTGGNPVKFIKLMEVYRELCSSH
jgi:DnaJ-domain-containing protein 1